MRSFSVAFVALHCPLLEVEVNLWWSQLVDIVLEGLKLHRWVCMLECIELHSHGDQLLCGSLCESLSEADTVPTKEGSKGEWVATPATWCIEMLRIRVEAFRNELPVVIQNS